MRPGSATRRLLLRTLACASGCTASNPLFELGTPPAVDASGDTAAAVPDNGGRDGDSGMSSDGPAGMATGSLIGLWRFDDGPTSGTALDVSGYGHHGVVEGLDVSRAWVAGRVGGFALEFPPRGTNDTVGVRIPLTPTIDDLRAFTVAAWIKRKISNATNYSTVISRQIEGTDDEIFDLVCSQTDLLVFIPRTSLGMLGDARGLGAAPDDKWIYVAATYDGGVLRLYAEGVEVGSGSYPDRLRSATTPLYIGTNKNTIATEPFEGLIDEVALFSRALSAADIKALAAGGSPYTFR